MCPHRYKCLFCGSQDLYSALEREKYFVPGQDSVCVVLSSFSNQIKEYVTSFSQSISDIYYFYSMITT
jgi:hypothetical protein